MSIVGQCILRPRRYHLSPFMNLASAPWLAFVPESSSRKARKHWHFFLAVYLFCCRYNTSQQLERFENNLANILLFLSSTLVQLRSFVWIGVEPLVNLNIYFIRKMRQESPNHLTLGPCGMESSIF
jgi:hypothetical protein